MGMKTEPRIPLSGAASRVSGKTRRAKVAEANGGGSCASRLCREDDLEPLKGGAARRGGGGNAAGITHGTT
jgi:hypothetical protein